VISSGVKRARVPARSSTVLRGCGPSTAVRGAELFAGASTRATAMGLWDEVSVLQV
jgi:hypothetical protein